MGMQIQIAQSAEDERTICRLLQDKFLILALPWAFTDAAIRPQPLGQCEAMSQVLFLAEFEDLVLPNICPVLLHPGEYHVYPRAGLCLEWTRTQWSGGRCRPGRYYLTTQDPVSTESFLKLKQAYSYLTRQIKRTYPRIDTVYKAFVGPDLTDRLANHIARMTDSSGNDIALVENTAAAVRYR